MTPDTPYRFVEIWVPKGPKGAKYRDPITGWPTIWGDLIQPFKNALCKEVGALNRETLFHGLREGPWFQLCWTVPPWWREDTLRSPDHKLLRRLCREKGFRVRRVLHGGTAGGALTGPRWNPSEDTSKAVTSYRSLTLLRALDSVCTLYASTLVPVYRTGRGKRGLLIKGDQKDVTLKNPPFYWTTMSLADRSQNPRGSICESFMHLVANITQASFDVQVAVRTGWMAHEETQRAALTCHL